MQNNVFRLWKMLVIESDHKVLVALKEKEIKFKSAIVRIRSGEHTEAWYMRINPSGLVPTLQDGDRIVQESEIIVDYIDDQFSTGCRLVPDQNTEAGQDVSKWRRILEEVKMYTITFGTICYPELSVSGLKLPKTMLKSRTDILAGNELFEKRMEQLAEEHPDLREAYTAKAAAFHQRPAMLRKESVVEALDEVDAILDQVEEHMTKVGADTSKETWFCGPQFTAADITLCILLGRLYFLGLSERYYSPDKRPRLHAYWELAKNRSSIDRYVLNMAKDLTD